MLPDMFVYSIVQYLALKMDIILHYSFGKHEAINLGLLGGKIVEQLYHYISFDVLSRSD